MSTERSQMIQALKQLVIPELRNLGFKGSFPHFRRVHDSAADLLVVQFNKYGGSFTIEIATLSEQEASSHWKADLSLSTATVYDAKRRARLNSRAPDKWFSFGADSAFDQAAQEALNTIRKDGLLFWQGSNPSFHRTASGGR